jgi:AcrR family transcriptional regulator
MEGSLSRLTQVKPGGHPLRREIVVRHQRERVLGATVSLVAEKGYRAVSVAAIVAEAGVSRLKFYENFSSKQDAFLAAYDAGLEEACRRVAAALEGAGEKAASRVPAGIGALLDLLGARPDMARALVIEARSVGSELSGRPTFTAAALAPLLDGARKGAAKKLPAGTEDSVLGGLDALVYQALLSGEPEPITELLPALVEFTLLPFLGVERARAAALA